MLKGWDKKYLRPLNWKENIAESTVHLLFTLFYFNNQMRGKRKTETFRWVSWGPASLLLWCPVLGLFCSITAEHPAGMAPACWCTWAPQQVSGLGREVRMEKPIFTDHLLPRLCLFPDTDVFLGSWTCWVAINSVLHVVYLPNSIHLLSLVSKTLGWVLHFIAHPSPQMEPPWLEMISVSTSKRWHLRLGTQVQRLCAPLPMIMVW